MRILIRLILVLGLLFSPIGPALAQPRAPQADGPALYHKSQVGLMPPAYGAAPAAWAALAAHTAPIAGSWERM